MSLTTFSSLPDPILHLICVYLTPDRPAVNDDEHGQSPMLYRPIINLSLTAHSLNRISSVHIPTNINLTDACARWDLFLRTVTTNPTYASNVKYLKLNDSTVNESDGQPFGKRLEDMLRALSGLEVLYSHHGTSDHAHAIVHVLTSKPLPLWDTLKVVRFDHTNTWGEECIVQLDLEREDMEDGRTHGKYTSGTKLLTGELEGLKISEFLKIPDVSGVNVSTRDFENDGDDHEDADWVDEDEEEVDDDSDGWSERDYEDNSEESDWDSEDESDYEDDWEAEYGFSVPKAEPTKDLPVPNTAVVAPGRSLLDF